MEQTPDGARISLIAALERYIKAILKVCVYVAGAIIIAIMLMTAVHVIGRYGFDIPVPGLVEITSYLMIVMVSLIVAYVMVENRNITVGLLVDHFSERTQAIIDSVSYTLGLAFAIVATWQTFLKGIYVTHTGQYSSVLEIPEYPFFFSVSILWGLLSVAVVIRLVHIISRAVKK